MAANKNDIIVTLSIQGEQYSAALKKAAKDNATFKKSAKDAGGGIDAITAAAKKMAPGLSAAAAAYKIFDTATKDSQGFADEWARIVRSAEATYSSFVSALTSGDYSSFFSNMRLVVSSAREAADALDNLSTVNIFADAELSDFEVQIAEQRKILKDQTKTAEEWAAASKKIKELRASQAALVDKKVTSNLEAFEATAAQNLAEKGYGGIKTGKDGKLQIPEEYRERYTTLSGYDKAMENAKKIQKRIDKEVSEAIAKATAQGGGYGAVSMGKAVRDRIISQLSDSDLFDLKLSEVSDEKLTEALKYKGMANQLQIKRANEESADFKLHNRAATTLGKEIGKTAADMEKEAIEEYKKQHEAELQSILGGEWERSFSMKGIKETWRSSSDKFSTVGGAGIAPLDVSDMELKTPSMQAPTKDMNGYAMAISNVSTAFHQLNELMGGSETVMGRIVGAMGGVLDSIVSTVSAYGSLITASRAATAAQQSETATTVVATAAEAAKGVAKSGSSMPFPYNIAAMAAFAAGALAIISSVKNAVSGGFATGGIVGGTSYRGDRLTANINSGEMILNRQQQRNLFDMANERNSGRNGISTVRGEDIYIALSNYQKRTGKRIN